MAQQIDAKVLEGRAYEMGLGAKDAEGDPKPQMFNMGIGSNANDADTNDDAPWSF